ncbi:MAG: protein translocase subunit SecF [Myxococcales bacterium]|nr:protein translocase subunit SecF [Myxococcales bacterium]
MASDDKGKTHKFFEIVPPGTNLQFVKKRWRFISLSLVLVAISLASLIYNQVTTGSPLNFGIDFAGGSQIQLAFAEDKPVDVGAVREALDARGYEGSSAVEVPDKPNEVLVRIKETISIEDSTLGACEEAAKQVGDATLLEFNHPEDSSKLFLVYDHEPNYREVERLLGAAGCQGAADRGAAAGGAADEEEAEKFHVEVALIGIGAKVREDLEQVLGEGTVDHIVRAETVGSKVGGQLKEDGVKSMLFAIGFIFLFVMFRFDLRFAPGGIVALTHDAFLVIGAFALTGKEFNLQTIAAILTIIGYSINDTIVVFDRVRERVALHRDEPIEVTTNQALNDTLSRTLLTSITTLMVVVATYVLGTGPIKDFSFALIVGLVVGTYSSLYIATPVFLWVNRRFYKGQGHLRMLDKVEREGTGTLLGGQAEDDDGGSVGDGDDDEGDTVARDEPPAGVRKASRRRRRRRPEGEGEGDDA